MVYFVFSGLLLCSGGKTSNKRRGACHWPDLRPWGPRVDSVERAWSLRTTEGACSWILKGGRRLWENWCQASHCGSEQSRTQQPPACPFPKQGPAPSSLGPLCCSGKAQCCFLRVWPAPGPLSAGPAELRLLSFLV